ncbi:MAG: acylphosphatase [Rhodospirillales bacterium]
MSDSTDKHVRVIVNGRVQGVWYRAWTVENATELGLSGWVRNRHDSTVEASLAGPADVVDAMIGRMRKGPPLADVTRLDVADDPEPVEPGFHQRSTV